MSRRVTFVLLAIAAGGCDRPLVCGEGTVELDGECRVGEAPDILCGAGTVWDPTSGLCRNAELVDLGVCDPETTDRTVDDAGVPHCVGTGIVNCATPAACPSPSTGRTSICGNLHDTQTGLRIEAEAEGLEVRVYDALAFAASSPDSRPPPIGMAYPDACGRFVAENIVIPFTTFIAVAAQDRDEIGADEGEWVLTGVAASPVSGQTLAGLRAYATRHATDAAWSASASLPAPSFAVRGVYLPIFIDPSGAPAPDVVIAHSGSITDPASDHYFADADGPDVRLTVDPARAATGPNGSGLWLGGDLMEFTGVGGESPGCAWPKTLAKAVPGAVFVQERLAECD